MAMNWRPALLFLAPVVAAIAWVTLRGPESRRTAPEPTIAAQGGPGHARATIIVYDDGKSAPGRRVIFHATDGGILDSVETGADGRASGPVVEGGLVTVAFGTSTQHLISIAGVAANEEVLVGEPEDEG